MKERTERSRVFHSAIAGFIEARREAKFGAEGGVGEAASRYEFAAWLADAARRVGQIQAVTHVLKATHPDGKGSSLHVRPDSLPQRAEIGSHVLGPDFAEDVVGNAAALDVYKLLTQEVEGRRLLDWMREGDADLRAALHDDPVVASSWMEAFGNLIRHGDPASHETAKQLYWLVSGDPAVDGGYHLLQPMFSSALAHAVHEEIQDALFGEDNKSSRRAFQAKEACLATYRDYRNLAMRKLGGSKPQNISQLNSERRGSNYLLASLPPTWSVGHPSALLNIDSAMERLVSIKEVGESIGRLATFLLADPPANDRTRQTRQRIEQELSAQLAMYAAAVWARFEPGWTADEDCRLPLHQKVWLDPGRVEDIARDPADPGLSDSNRQFIAHFEWGSWPDQVAGDFADWINGRLRAAGLTSVGDTEHRHWAKQAIVDTGWPVKVQRRAPAGGRA